MTYLFQTLPHIYAHHPLNERKREYFIFSRGYFQYETTIQKKSCSVAFALNLKHADLAILIFNFFNWFLFKVAIKDYFLKKMSKTGVLNKKFWAFLFRRNLCFSSPLCFFHFIYRFPWDFVRDGIRGTQFFINYHHQYFTSDSLPYALLIFNYMYVYIIYILYMHIRMCCMSLSCELYWNGWSALFWISISISSVNVKMFCWFHKTRNRHLFLLWYSNRSKTDEWQPL